MCGLDIFSSPYLLFCPLSSILTFSSASHSLPWHQAQCNQPLNTSPKKHYLLSYLISPSPTSLFKPVPSWLLTMLPCSSLFLRHSLALTHQPGQPETISPLPLTGYLFSLYWSLQSHVVNSLHFLVNSPFPPSTSCLLCSHSLCLVSLISANNKMLVCVAETLRQLSRMSFSQRRASTHTVTAAAQHCFWVKFNHLQLI